MGLLWDCYSVHWCESLLATLKGLYKPLIVLFVLHEPTQTS